VRIEVRIARRRALLLPGTGELHDTLASVYPGPDGARQLRVSGESVKTTEEGEVSRYSVEGLICEPGAMRRTRDHLFLAVNGRPVQSRSLAFAVEQAYQGLSMPGQFPLGALSLTLPPTDVDVNVHPTKREVRFRDERRVFALVQSMCRKALEGSAAYRGAGLLDAAGSLELRDGEKDSRLFASDCRRRVATLASPPARALPAYRPGA
jgi:DNA mismatch repair protein MutL